MHRRPQTLAGGCRQGEQQRDTDPAVPVSSGGDSLSAKPTNAGPRTGVNQPLKLGGICQTETRCARARMSASAGRACHSSMTCVTTPE